MQRAACTPLSTSHLEHHSLGLRGLMNSFWRTSLGIFMSVWQGGKGKYNRGITKYNTSALYIAAWRGNYFLVSICYGYKQLLTFFSVCLQKCCDYYVFLPLELIYLGNVFYSDQLGPGDYLVCLSWYLKVFARPKSFLHDLSQCLKFLSTLGAKVVYELFFKVKVVHE